MSEKLCLQWNDFKENATSAFGILRGDNDFADVTLACEDGEQFEAHKVILASSSPFFQNILRRNKHAHPLIYMRGMKSEELAAVMDFLYCGEANVDQENLESFFAIAEELQLQGFKTNNDEVKEIPESKVKEIPEFKVKEIPESRKIKTESQIPKFSAESSQAQNVDKNVGKMGLTSNFSGDLQELDNKTNTMMVKSSNKSVRGKRLHTCTVCGKESEITQLKNHIEANHLKGISVPCNLCNKTFKSRNALSIHKHSNHKG